MSFPARKAGQARFLAAQITACLLGVLLLLSASSASAQDDRLLGAEVQQLELELRDVRFENLRQRRSEGWTLVVGGVLSTLGGVAALVWKPDDEAWLAGSVTTISFGVINTLLGMGLLDAGGARRQAVIDHRLYSYSQYRPVRETEIKTQRSAALAYGINFGLDFLYIGAGVLLYALGQANDDRPWLKGAGIAMASQGAFLWAFDLAGLIRARRRARAVEQLSLH